MDGNFSLFKTFTEEKMECDEESRLLVNEIKDSFVSFIFISKGVEMSPSNKDIESFIRKIYSDIDSVNSKGTVSFIGLKLRKDGSGPKDKTGKIEEKISFREQLNKVISDKLEIVKKTLLRDVDTIKEDELLYLSNITFKELEELAATEGDLKRAPENEQDLLHYKYLEKHQKFYINFIIDTLFRDKRYDFLKFR